MEIQWRWGRDVDVMGDLVPQKFAASTVIMLRVNSVVCNN
jgi:hypothetical protein